LSREFDPECLKGFSCAALFSFKNRLEFIDLKALIVLGGLVYLGEGMLERATERPRLTKTLY